MASTAATTVMTIPITGLLQPNTALRPLSMMTVSMTLKPTYVKSVPASARMTPRYPSWARDCTIWGSPSQGPCEAWKAMKKVPNRMPSVLASEVQPSGSPIAGPTKPIATVYGWKLPQNQNGPWCQTLPCRSPSGT